MSLVRRLTTANEFLDWRQEQKERFEVMNGQPRMLNGATRGYDGIVVNNVPVLHDAVRSKPCQPTTADAATPHPFR
jgi:hypothetical protein